MARIEDEAELQSQPAVMLLEVTNRNDFEINDMFNGIPVTFPTGQKVEITPDQALHFFAWPGDDADRAMHMAKRYGWGSRQTLEWTPGTRQPLWFEMAMKIEVHPVYFDLVRRRPSDPIPADDGSDPDDTGPAKIRAEEAGLTKAGKRNKRAAPGRRKMRETERIR
jgi:hypothetical protein